MTHPADQRSVEKTIDDLLDASSAADEIVNRGIDAWNSDRLLRLAGEAVINRIGDAANKLPEEVRNAIPEVPSDEIRSNRILVAHIYHRIDYQILWETLVHDVPPLAQALTQWRENISRRPGRSRP
ncbi:HepT-like ribonuclease domain-containing protein [Ferrimicrobium sp.]|uniref:HepT-like ribonuclease domain-containing protein n=1 Tax=Ferrimicrobium sp. TaxID=2926050 RepID=UPI00261DBD85|nr:HepT-like ribonuclease domain-containing protein [Ferrimicrobium sp.]